MTDRGLLSQFDPEATGVPSPPSPPSPQKPAEADGSLFAQFDPEKVGAVGPQPESTAFGAARRAAGRGVLPAAGGIVGFGAGAEIGGVAGMAVGGPVGAFVGALGGGLIGSMGASWGVSKAQDAALASMPESWQDALGQSESQRIADETKHPMASFLGGVVPFAVTMRPGASAPFLAKLPENATALQRILANPATARVFGGGLMGGMELGTEFAHGDVDWRKVAISTGMGLVLNKQTKLGDTIMGVGQSGARAVIPSGTMRRYEEMRGSPTLAQAADEKVAGAGVTEEVFHGTERQDPGAERAAQNTARTEAVAFGEPEVKVDPHDVARRMEPELFARRDALEAQIDSFRRTIAEHHNPPESAFVDAEARAQRIQDELTAHIEAQNGYVGGKEARRLRAELRDAQGVVEELRGRQARYSAGLAEETPELAAIRQRLVAADMEMRDLGREIAASYRRAEEHIGGGHSVPAPAPLPETPPTRFWSLPEMIAATDGSQRPAGVSAPAATAPTDGSQRPAGVSAPIYAPISEVPDAAGTSKTAGSGRATTFQTAKGSTYEVHDDGTTTRTKAARADVGHEGDEGLKPRSAKTVYIASEDGQRLALPQGTARIIDHGDGTLSVATKNKDGQWGIAPSGRNVPFTTQPEKGRTPVELWKPETVNGLPAYRTIHLGNEITSVGAAPETAGTRAKPVKVEAPDDVAAARDKVNTEPTPAQAEAGNYRKGHIEFDGLPISIENPKGSTRSGVDPDGKGKPVEPAPAATAPTGDRTAIVADVKQRLMRTGMREDEAAANAEIWGAYYETRAARFAGARGSALDLYRASAPDIAGPTGRLSPFEIGPAAAKSRLAPPPAEPPKVGGRTLADGSYRPGVLARRIDEADAVKAEWRRSSPIKTADALFADAQRNQTHLADVAAQIAEATGARFKNPGVKGRARTEEKIAAGKAPGAINDVVRGGFEVDSPSQASKIIDMLGEHFEVADEGWFVTPAGYFDRKVILRMPNGQGAEVQIFPPQLYAVKERMGHILYEKARSLPADAPEVAELERQMRALYQPVFESLAPEWKAEVGKGGSSGNLAANAAGSSTRDSMAATAELTRDQASPENIQASPTLETTGSPSQELNVTPAGAGKEAIASSASDMGRLPADVNASINGRFGEGWGSDRPTRTALTAEFMRTTEAATAVVDRLNAVPVDKQAAELPRYTPGAGRQRADGEPAGVFMFKPTELNVDADRFQFKSGGDAYGVTGALRSVTKWDPAKAQAIIVWEQKDGRLFVADGHQRAGLARRLTEQGLATDIELPGILYREADGISAADARAIAAMTNIANGSGSALDGAKVLRSRPDLMDGSLPLSIGKGKQAAMLARLDDEAFRMAVNKVVPEHYAALVGELVGDDGPRQIAAMKALAQIEPKNADEAGAVIARVKAAELAKAEEGRQASMFDDFSADTTAVQEMRIVGRAIADLKKDRNLFRRVVSNAGRIEETGSHIERDVAHGIVTDADIFARTLQSEAYAKGEVRDALVDAARELKNGSIGIGQATERVLSALRRQAEGDGDARSGAGAGVEPRPDAGGPGAAEPVPGAVEFAQEGRNGEIAPDRELFQRQKPREVYHAAYEEFDQPDFSRLGSVTKENAGGLSHEEWALNLAKAGFWTSLDAISEKMGAPHSLRFEISGRVKKFKSLDALERAIAAAGGPEKFRNKMVADGVSHAEVRDEEFGTTSFVTFQQTDIRRLKAAPAEQPGELFQAQASGKIRIVPGKRSLITLAAKSDASTFMHESGHQFLEDLMADAMHASAPAQLKDDADTVLRWLGAKSAEDIKTKHHEKFARGFEQYLREGVAPSTGLVHVFAQFKTWLTAIYQTLRGLGKPISDDIRGVFDRMLAETPERTVIVPERERAPLPHETHERDAELTHPAEADAAADRIRFETDSAQAAPPQEIAHEIAAALQKDAAAQAGRAGQPAGEAGRGAPAAGDMALGGAGPGPVAGGEPVGARSQPELRGGGEAAAERAGVRGDDRGPGTGDGLGDAPFATRPTHRVDAASESPFVDKAGNIRVENLTTREDVAQAIRDSAEANNDFIADRRGVVTDGQVMDLAADLGMRYTDLLQRKVGEAFNAEQVVAARKLLVQSATDVAAAMKKAATGTEQDVIAYAQARDRHHLIQAQIAGITAEAGRALRAFRDISMTGEAAAADQIVRQATGRTLFQLRREAQLGLALETPQQVSAWMRATQDHSFGRMLLEFWINSLLSGPSTHATNMLGNTILAMWKAIPETAAAAAIGKVRRALGRDGETVQFGEIGASFKARSQSQAAALKAGLDSFERSHSALLPGEKPEAIQGVDPDYMFAAHAQIDPNAKFSDTMASAFGIARGLRDGFLAAGGLLKGEGVAGAPAVGLEYSPRGAIPNVTVKGVTVLPTGDLARLPSRFLSAVDSYFKATNYSMDIAAQAYRAAATAGLEGEAFTARVAYLRANPTPEMMQAAIAETQALTLMGRGGEFTRRLSQLVGYEMPGGLKPLKFVDPFVRVASNIINETMMKRSPLGVLSPEIRKDLSGANGTIAQDKAMARMLVGTATAVTAGLLAAEGYVSGSGPTDRNDAAMWRLAGNQAHSVRIGEMWYDIHRLGPVGMLISLAADLYEMSHTAAEGDFSEAAAHLHHAITQNVLDQSFMKGPADLIKAIDDPGRYGANYINNFLSSFLPYSVGMGQVARAMDPYSRQARTVVDAMKAKVPGLSTEVMPRRDIWGEPIERPKAVGIPVASAIYGRKINNDPVNRALLDLGVSPAPVQKKIRNVELTPQQYDDFSRIAGRTAKMRLDTIVTSAQWQNWPDYVREQVVRETVKQARETARGMMMMKYPQIMKDAVAAKREAMGGGLSVSARGM